MFQWNWAIMLSCLQINCDNSNFLKMAKFTSDDFTATMICWLMSLGTNIVTISNSKFDISILVLPKLCKLAFRAYYSTVFSDFLCLVILLPSL